MSRQAKLISIVVLGLIIIAGIIFYFINWQRQAREVENIVDETAPVETIDVSPQRPVTIETPAPTSAEVQASLVKTVSLSFVERFGTYTNHSNFVNVEELTPVMTASMVDWAMNTYAPRLRQDHDPAGFFYRIVTRAPSAEILAQTETNARVKVSTQREETSGVEAPRQFLQTILLDLVKENNQWLIDGAYWQ